MFSVRAAAYKRAVTPATAAKDALVAHAAHRPATGADLGADFGTDPSYPAEVRALLARHDAEIDGVTRLFFGPSRFSRFVDWATSNPPVVILPDPVQPQLVPQLASTRVTASRRDL